MVERARPGEHVPTILVIDDESVNLQIVKLAVTRQNLPCNMVLLGSAQEGLEFLEDHPAHLILLDVVMPGMNGFEFFAKIKSEPRWADIPVIFFSASNEPESIMKGLEMGAVDYIGKPIIAQVLAARFRSALRIKFLQSELKSRNAELENANRLKDEFLSFCSHDLRAPISAIELTCQFLADRIGESSVDETQEIIGRIVNQTRLARRLVETLLDTNKIEEGRVVPQPTFFSPRELLDGCVLDHQPMILARNLKLTVDIDRDDAVCFGDREMIAQTVRNVLGNAVKFACTKIGIVSRAGPLDGEGPRTENAGHWTLEISDDGAGIPAGDEEAIFEKYARSGLRDAGYGLGLYIARQTANLHRGSIRARSAPGGGTCIEFRLPFAFSRGALPDLSSVSHASVRIVSTARETAALLETILIEGGLVNVISGPVDEGANDALDQIEAAKPHLSIVDVASRALDVPRMIRMMSHPHAPTRWLLIGSPSELSPMRGHVPFGTALLELPLNPLQCLRVVGELCADEPGRLLAAR